MNHYLYMALLMIPAGLLSTMNVWANSWSDVRLSLNDAYMIALMTGWMLLFMGLGDKNTKVFLVGSAVVILAFAAIRFQVGITENQFLLGMIPHHSMAVLMSKQLQSKPNQIGGLLENIIKSQSEEIQWMKSYVAAAP